MVASWLSSGNQSPWMYRQNLNETQQERGPQELERACNDSI